MCVLYLALVLRHGASWKGIVVFSTSAVEVCGFTSSSSLHVPAGSDPIRLSCGSTGQPESASNRAEQARFLYCRIASMRAGVAVCAAVRGSTIIGKVSQNKVYVGNYHGQGS